MVAFAKLLEFPGPYNIGAEMLPCEWLKAIFLSELYIMSPPFMFFSGEWYLSLPRCSVRGNHKPWDYFSFFLLLYIPHPLMLLLVQLGSVFSSTPPSNLTMRSSSTSCSPLTGVFFFNFYLFMIVRGIERERGRDTGRGRSRLHTLGARRGIRSRVSRIAPWAKGRRQTAAPPRDPHIYTFLNLSLLIYTMRTVMLN